MQVPDRASVTYRGHWPNDFGYVSAASYVADISSKLTARGLITRSSNWVGTVLGGIPFGGMDVELILQLQNGLGFGDENDIISLVRHEVYNATGEYPTSDTILAITIPGAPPTETDQPRPKKKDGETFCSGPKDQTGNWSFTCWTRSLTTEGMWMIGLLAVGALAAVLLISQGGRIINRR